jgi:hypothetical protein
MAMVGKALFGMGHGIDWGGSNLYLEWNFLVMALAGTALVGVVLDGLAFAVISLIRGMLNG